MSTHDQANAVIQGRWVPIRSPGLLVAVVLWAVAAQAFQAGPPGNDACGNAKLVSDVQYTDTVISSAATTDPDDPSPLCGNSSRGKSVWYRFTAPGPGTTTVNTFGSDYDTILSAYTGSCGTLLAFPEGCNDDDPQDGAQSQVSFHAAEGTTYYFMVTAYNGDGGTLLLHLTFMLAPVCVGDCDADGTVTQAECAICQRIFAGAPLSLCPPCDANGDGRVVADELNLCALALRSCVTPTAALTPTASPLRTPTPPKSAPPATPTPTRSPSATPMRLSGDCDGDGRIAANDIAKILTIMVNCPCASSSGGIAEGCAHVPGRDKQCVSADLDGDHCISSNELSHTIARLFAETF